MSIYKGYIKGNVNGFTNMTHEQKYNDIYAINALLYKMGLSVTGGKQAPTRVRYEVQLAPDSDITKIMKLKTNFQIALNDDSVTLSRKGATLYIEKRGADNTLYFGDAMTREFMTSEKLTTAIGVGTDGYTYMDLEDATHVLIAGTTGSGKSVLENVIISSLMVNHPNIEIYGVDTKRVEFLPFAYNPKFHLVTDAYAATRTLQELCKEMEQRFNTFSQNRVTDIKEYNANGGNMNPIVVVVDEFADLMLLSGKTVEEYVVRLAQKARACGIHLVLATQRPTADVITGLIKANIPTRICLKVNSGLDSRIILDRKGGETLTGHGDMLYLANGAYEPIRTQGFYISNTEKSNIACIAKVRQEGKATLDSEMPKM